MKKFYLLILMFVMGIVAIAPVAAQDDTPDVIGGDEAQLRQFISRMFGNSMGDPNYQTTFWIGSLPDEELPFDLALPEDALLIGSTVNTDPMGSYLQILVESGLSAKEITDFYESTFSGDEWTQPYNGGYEPGGFALSQYVYKQFCFNSNEAFIEVNANQYDETTQIRFYVRYPGDAYMCNAPEIPVENPMDPYQMLPLIQATDGVSFMNGSGGGGGGGMYGMESASSNVTLITDLTIAEFIPAFDSQIEADGWTQTFSENSDNMALSTWTLTDDDGTLWETTFTVTASSVKDGQYLAYLYVQKHSEE